MLYLINFRIAFGPKRWRVVTLDGKLVDITGTMSGGAVPNQSSLGTLGIDDPETYQHEYNEISKLIKVSLY